MEELEMVSNLSEGNNDEGVERSNNNSNGIV